MVNVNNGASDSKSRLARCAKLLVVAGALATLALQSTASSYIGGNSAIVTVLMASVESDTDGDGLSDSVEAQLGTDPASPDSDSDAMDDAWEVQNGLEPNDPLDADNDYDGDGLSNVDEYLATSSPYDVDTDGDEFADAIEVARGTSPSDYNSQPSSTVSGDVNCDGKVDATDVQLVTNGALGLTTPVPVDVNKVGGVNALDVQVVINAAVGK